MYRARIRAERELLRRKTACLGNMFAQEIGGHAPEIQKQILDLFRGMQQRLAVVIQEGQRTGDIAAKLPAKTLAEFIENAWRGAARCSPLGRKRRRRLCGCSASY